MNVKLFLTVIAVVTLGASCAPKTVVKGSYIRLTTGAAETIRVNPADVKVYYKKQPDFEFHEIGIVEGMAIGSKAGLSDLIPELQRQSAMMGGTAIHAIEIQRHSQSGNALHATAIAIIRK